jgi:hypothetical protein
MLGCRPRALASERLTVVACGLAVIAVTLAAAVAGCSTSPGKTDSTAAVSCGTARTAANVPVHVQIVRGQVACTTAMQVERAYASAIASGQVPGTGGGAPVKVQGWTCQGFTTPVVLKTGDTSKCVKDSTEILAILPSPA